MKHRDISLYGRSTDEAMEETAYLLSSPANREHLMESLKEAEEGKVVDLFTDDL